MARITEQELADIVRVAGELEATAITVMDVPSEGVLKVNIGTVAVRLVGEVRRLRGLLCVASDYVVQSDAWCPGCSRTIISAPHRDKCPVAEIEAEVKTIRAEFGG